MLDNAEYSAFKSTLNSLIVSYRIVSYRAYCYFELCRDCGLGCFSELLLADTQRLSVLAVVFLYQITVFLQQTTAASLLELYLNDSMQTVYTCGSGGGSQQREVADGADGPMGLM